ncbi:Lipopolysaccharide kinase (Kdo/WaaP) family [Candidatus Methanoperedens nitroreducens]|uniref:Lipopolysaccharide kinase (Kdo/WaaP) family n=1 Tax=Candidatus Methanoperedens nitratireducens TaxID=1392998 RepID=A0A062V0P6_9EURY|nr:lipopolysaccharide kinase InaA family protein [Candidatus Methanoperedens nitroreducens]KCZ72721.1 Lipopolysaccharide kinase (Kdo/WaaP) family [Candidatus Methanoperedens nitroreducens]MDJ1423346.1 lipopolysaccharide kinase InaA family protein [Candidatus Methanoperedens sp.]
MNKIERHYDERKGDYIRKRFYNSFFSNCYSDFIAIAVAIPLGLKPKSGKSRKHTEAKRYREFNKRGFPVPKLLEEGEDYLDIEFIKMKELSRLLRDKNASKQKKIEIVKRAAAEIRRIHDAGFELGDANVHNVGCRPDGRIVLFDFEHQQIKENREKDYSTFARSAAYEIPDSSDLRDILTGIAEGYGEDLTRKISIVPYMFVIFLLENKSKNLLELIKAKRHGIKR